VPAVAHEHGVSLSAAAFAFGLAVGLRLGQRFWPARSTRRYLADDFSKLDRNQRDRVTRIVRNMLKGYDVFLKTGPKPGPRPRTMIAADLEAAQRWKREARQRVRNEETTRALGLTHPSRLR
jgi:hypothetical protein